MAPSRQEPFCSVLTGPKLTAVSVSFVLLHPALRSIMVIMDLKQQFCTEYHGADYYVLCIDIHGEFIESGSAEMLGMNES